MPEKAPISAYHCSQGDYSTGITTYLIFTMNYFNLIVIFSEIILILCLSMGNWKEEAVVEMSTVSG